MTIIGFCIAPSGLIVFLLKTPGLRPGLFSFGPPGLKNKKYAALGVSPALPA